MPSAFELYQKTSNVIGQEKARKQLAVLLERQQMVAAGKIDHAAGAILAGWTEVGYVGLNLTQMFLPLLMDAARMLEREKKVETTPRRPGKTRRNPAKDALSQEVIDRAATGVLLLDEFDKWMLTGEDGTGRNTGKKLQSELLKMVEGSIEFISDDDDNIGVQMDTSRVLVICAGAFVGLMRQVARRLERDYADEGMWDLVEPADFVRFGLLPELAGRLSTHIFTRPLKVEHLVSILKTPGGIVDEYRARFEAMGIQWSVTDEALGDVARIALDRLTGARGVEHVMWQRFSEALFEASNKNGHTAVTYSVNAPRAVLV
jgi:ATP-dependent protease HslVU (ClpYQ) ATPase subunit